MSKILGQIIDLHWHKFGEKLSPDMVLTTGFNIFNVLCSLTNGSGKFYKIYENPYFRYYFENLFDTTKDAIRLTPDMAKEYPVPLPSEIDKHAQQKVFQVTTVEELIAQQKKLQELIISTGTLLKHNFNYKKQEVMRRRKEWQANIEENLAKYPTKTTFHIFHFIK